MPNTDAAFAAMNQNDEATQALISQKGAEQAPLIAKAQDTLSQPHPEQPKLQEPPKAPDNNFGKDAQEWATAMSVLSGVVGAFSRQHATAALNAFASGMKGFKEGQKDTMDESFKQWEASTKAAVESNRTLQDQYKNILDDRKLTQDEQLEQIKLVAAKYQDQLTYQAAEAKNMILISKIMLSQQNAATRAEQSAEKLALQKEKVQGSFKEAQEMMKVYQGANPGGIKNAEDAKKFQDWAKNQWPGIKQGMGLGGTENKTGGAKPDASKLSDTEERSLDNGKTWWRLKDGVPEQVE